MRTIHRVKSLALRVLYKVSKSRDIMGYKERVGTGCTPPSGGLVYI